MLPYWGDDKLDDVVHIIKKTVKVSDLVHPVLNWVDDSEDNADIVHIRHAETTLWKRPAGTCFVPLSTKLKGSDNCMHTTMLRQPKKDLPQQPYGSQNSAL